MRKICVITERRAEYGILKPVLRAIQNKRGLRLCHIVTGSHLSDQFGYTINNIKKDGFKVDYKIPVSLKGDAGADMSRNVGEWIKEITKIMEKERPDIMLIGFDIGAHLAAAVVCNYMNIPVAHIHGGDVSGHVDDNIRHAITKLSHIHFPATKKSADRICKMGEEKWRIHVVGAPGLDSIKHKDFLKNVSKKYKLNESKPILLVIQHPVSTEIRDAAIQMKKTMQSVMKLGCQCVVIYPNYDAGGRRMIKIIEQYRKFNFIQIYKSLPHEDYLGLLNISSVLIGNSSSGIVEAASFRLPVVNIGTRQLGRERSGNVIDVDYDEKQITNAIEKALHDKKFISRVKKCRNIYGDGNAGKRIADILSKVKIDRKLLEKRMSY